MGSHLIKRIDRRPRLRGRTASELGCDLVKLGSWDDDDDEIVGS
jgi:hypothetical protein